ncbi:hypothetical protein EVA_19067, partial [gut metagenome]
YHNLRQQYNFHPWLKLVGGDPH